jgi:hypothetical protein
MRFWWVSPAILLQTQGARGFLGVHNDGKTHDVQNRHLLLRVYPDRP